MLLEIRNEIPIQFPTLSEVKVLNTFFMNDLNTGAETVAEAISIVKNT